MNEHIFENVILFLEHLYIKYSRSRLKFTSDGDKAFPFVGPRFWHSLFPRTSDSSVCENLPVQTCLFLMFLCLKTNNDSSLKVLQCCQQTLLPVIRYTINPCHFSNYESRILTAVSRKMLLYINSFCWTCLDWLLLCNYYIHNYWPVSLKVK